MVVMVLWIGGGGGDDDDDVVSLPTLGTWGGFFHMEGRVVSGSTAAPAQIAS